MQNRKMQVLVTHVVKALGIHKRRTQTALRVGKATPHSSDLEDEEQQEVELVDDSMSLEEPG